MKWLDQYLIYIKLLGVAAIVVFAVWLTHDHYQGVIAKNEVAQKKAEAKLVKEKLEAIEKAGEQHAQDQDVIDTLTYDIGVMQHTDVPVFKCTGSKKDQDRRARAFSEAINRAVEEVRRADEADSKRADQLNIDAIENNNSK